ncbi:DUF952 domain-containing protein [Hyphomicrobium methylovorum]|uniref:DUF952 domain-containing protein n=1 Tax=Hyphomicrobium methylovorum TaxID=84 RepID=UPI0015E70A42|nr:DUF952 domain-containing protein [Hyphomicrobium methylovorum]MBA2125521.1 DUF952 domain-containing protein [Hyphomicrobium methylovorum]
MNHIVYKIARASEWNAAAAAGLFLGSPDDVRDGFIHLSSKEQLQGTLDKHFSGQNDLVLIAFEEQSLAPELKWEASRGGALFPHYYGALPISKALWHRPLKRGRDGIELTEET